MKKVGILALQGSFAEHARMLEMMGQEFILVRTKNNLENLTHLILPGGESTTMVKLLKEFGMWEEIQKQVQDDNLFVMGTCAGAILCSYLGMNIEVDRNGFGAQQSSFTDSLESEEFPDLRGVFIRAPRFKEKSPSNSLFEKEGGPKVLATYKGEPVMVEEKPFLALSFHPELSGDTRVHEYFLKW